MNPWSARFVSENDLHDPVAREKLLLQALLIVTDTSRVEVEHAQFRRWLMA